MAIKVACERAGAAIKWARHFGRGNDAKTAFKRQEATVVKGK